MPRLKERGIDVRPFFYPLSTIPAYRDTPEAAAARAVNKIGQAIAPYGINLPSALKLQRSDVAPVCSTLREITAATSERK